MDYQYTQNNLDRTVWTPIGPKTAFKSWGIPIGGKSQHI